MLELTRRMTSSRTHLVRIAGAYIDEEGFIDGTFNKNFLNLTGDDRKHALEIAKTIPYAKSNSELVEYELSQDAMKSGSIWQLLYAIRQCEMKNDALLLNLYEMLSESITPGNQYAIYVYQGIYDVTVKASDKELLEGSNEVYSYLLCAICPVHGDYETDLPVSGFLWPAFKNRSTDMKNVNVLELDKSISSELKEFLSL